MGLDITIYVSFFFLMLRFKYDWTKCDVFVYKNCRYVYLKNNNNKTFDFVQLVLWNETLLKLKEIVLPNPINIKKRWALIAVIIHGCWLWFKRWPIKLKLNYLLIILTPYIFNNMTIILAHVFIKPIIYFYKFRIIMTSL